MKGTECQFPAVCGASWLQTVLWSVVLMSSSRKPTRLFPDTDFPSLLFIPGCWPTVVLLITQPRTPELSSYLALCLKPPSQNKNLSSALASSQSRCSATRSACLEEDKNDTAGKKKLLSEVSRLLVTSQRVDGTQTTDICTGAP